MISLLSEKTYLGWHSIFNDFVDDKQLALNEDSLLIFCEHVTQTESPKHSSLYPDVGGEKSVLENTKGIHRTKSKDGSSNMPKVRMQAKHGHLSGVAIKSHL